MRKFKPCLFLAFLILNCYGEEEDNVILIPHGSHNVAAELGSNQEIACEQPEGKQVEWVLPDKEVASKNVSSDHVTQIGSSLLITNTSWADSGDYVCRLTDMSFNDTVSVKVYEMPTYYIEGVIIVSINSILLALFLVCVIVSAVKTRKRKRLQKYHRAQYIKS